MFTKGKKVELVLLIFVIISAMIAFSAFKLSKPESAIAADENKTEYTLSDFVAVPDDGIDFSFSSEAISANLAPAENQNIKFSFAIKLLDLQAKREIVVKFGALSITYSFSAAGSVSVEISKANVSSDEGKKYEAITKCQPNELITMSFDIAYKNISAFSIECGGSKVSKSITNGSLSKANII